MLENNPLHLYNRKESDYKQLEAFISRTYTLERDIENQCTYVADGYFGLHLNNE